MPSHTTHALQPLDVSVFKSLKDRYAKAVKSLTFTKKNFAVTKNDFSKVLKGPFEQAFSILNIKAGFAKCGIYPLNPDAIAEYKMKPSSLYSNFNCLLSTSSAESDSTQYLASSSASPNPLTASTPVSGVSGSPVAVSGTPIEVSGTPVAVSGTPVEVSSSSVAVSGTPVAVSGTPVAVSGTPVEVFSSSVAVSGTPVAVSGTPVEVSSSSVAISGTPVAVSGTPVEVSGTSVAVFGTPGAKSPVSNNVVVTLPTTSPHVVTSCVCSSGIVNLLVTAGLISPDLMDILATPTNDAAMSRKRTKRITGARELTSNEYVGMLQEEKRKKDEAEEEKLKKKEEKERKKKEREKEKERKKKGKEKEKERKKEERKSVGAVSGARTRKRKRERKEQAAM